MKNPLSPSSSSQNTKSTLPPQQSSSKRRLPRWVVFVLVGVVIVMGVIVIYNMMNGGGMNIGESVEQRKMEEYLEEKYGRKFVVKNYRIEGAGLGVEGDPTADGYPKDDTTLKFEVWDRGKFNEGKHAYSDDYYGEKWAREFESDLVPFLENTFGYLPYYEVAIGHESFTDDKKIEQPLPEFKKALEIYGDKVSMTVTVDQHEIINDSNLELHVERIDKIVNKLKTYNARIALYYSRVIESGSKRTRSPAGIHISKGRLKDVTKDELASMIEVEGR